MVSPDPNTSSDANSTGLSILKHMENEVIALKKQVCVLRKFLFFSSAIIFDWKFMKITKYKLLY